MDPRDRLRSVGKRITDPVEPLAQRIAERAIDIVVNALDINALVSRINLNAVLDHVDVNKVLAKVDVNALLHRVDVNALLDRADWDDVLRRLDVDALLDRVVIARSSGGVASEALDAARSQAVGLDQLIDRWVGRALRRKHPGPSAPPALLDAQAEA
jgi:hypothetical protein